MKSKNKLFVYRTPEVKISFFYILTCKIAKNSVVKTSYDEDNLCIYDRNQNKEICDYKSEAIGGDYYIFLDIVDPFSYGDETLTKINEGKTEKNCKTSTYSYERCLSYGDYYELAKRKCEAQGSRMANIAELQALANKGYLTSDNYNIFRAYEEVNGTDPGSYTVTHDGIVSGAPKDHPAYQSVCIGK